MKERNNTMKPMKKNDMITTITRECWKQWNHLSELALEIVADIQPGTMTYNDLRNIIDRNRDYSSALSIWYGMSELAERVGIDWMNAGYDSEDFETIEARESHNENQLKIWKMSKEGA